MHTAFEMKDNIALAKISSVYVCGEGGWMWVCRYSSEANPLDQACLKCQCSTLNCTQVIPQYYHV